MALQNTGSGFTNLNQIINANRNNQLGSTIQSGVVGAAQGAKQDLNKSQQEFQAGLEANKVDTDVNRQKVNQVLQDPTKATGGDIGAFDQFRSGKYAGPTQLSNVPQIQKETLEAQQLSQAAQNPGGRQALLQRFVGGPGYTQGEQGLDTVLLGATGGKQLQIAGNAAQGLGNAVNRGVTSAEQSGKQAQVGAQNFAKDVLGQIQKNYDPLSQNLDKSVAQAAAEQQAKYNETQRILNNLGNFKATSATQALEGEKIDPETGLVQKEYSNAGNATSRNFSTTGAIDSSAGGYVKNVTDSVSSLLNAGILKPSDIDEINKSIAEWSPNGYWDSSIYQGPDQKYLGGTNRQTQYAPNIYSGPGGVPDQVSRRSEADEFADQGIKNAQNLRVFSHPDAGANLLDLLQNSITNQQAQNLNRQGLADQSTRAKLDALNRLAGKQSEFANAPAYQQQATQFDIKKFNEALKSMDANLHNG